jgi:DNA-binding winged helix-turn-helix (wHTH) protein
MRGKGYKFQAPNPKFQTNSNDQNSKSKTKRPELGELDFGKRNKIVT